MYNTGSKSTLAVLFAACAFFPLTANADSGFYIGGSLGGATIEADFGDTGIPGFPQDIDEDDTAYKVFAGYKFDLPVLDLGIEAGYVDFGAPEIDVLTEEVELEPSGVNLWGIAGIEAGPVDLFAKVGYISWDRAKYALAVLLVGVVIRRWVSAPGCCRRPNSGINMTLGDSRTSTSCFA